MKVAYLVFRLNYGCIKLNSFVQSECIKALMLNNDQVLKLIYVQKSRFNVIKLFDVCIIEDVQNCYLATCRIGLPKVSCTEFQVLLCTIFWYYNLVLYKIC